MWTFLVLGTWKLTIWPMIYDGWELHSTLISVRKYDVAILRVFRKWDKEMPWWVYIHSVYKRESLTMLRKWKLFIIIFMWILTINTIVTMHGVLGRNWIRASSSTSLVYLEKTHSELFSVNLEKPQFSWAKPHLLIWNQKFIFPIFHTFWRIKSWARRLLKISHLGNIGADLVLINVITSEDSVWGAECQLGWAKRKKILIRASEHSHNGIFF